MPRNHSCEKLIFVAAKAGFQNIKIRSFQKNNLRGGVRHNSGNRNSKSYGEGIIGEVAQFRGETVFQLQPEQSFGRALLHVAFVPIGPACI